jgi:DNA polymerase III subunit beta
MPKLIECKRLDLLAALNVVMPVVETKNTIPILANIMISAEGKKISVEATNLDVMIRHNGIVRVDNTESEVAVTVNAKALYDFVKAAGADYLSILPDFEQKIASFNAGAARSLHILPVEDFPKEREYETPARFEISFGEMLTIIQTIKPAISIEETRYYLNGMFFEPRDINSLCVTATDGHRLHTMTVKADGLTAANAAATPFIIPRKTLSVVEKWLTGLVKTWAKSNEPAHTLSVEMGAKGTKFHCGPVTINSKNIDGTFPDWRRAVPVIKKTKKKGVVVNDKVAVLDSKALDKILKVVANNRNKHLQQGVHFSFKNDTVELSRSDPDSGKISDTMPCAYAGAPIEIGFNGSYVRDIIAALDNGSIEMIMADAGSPTMIRKVGVANPFCVLMPMRV